MSFHSILAFAILLSVGVTFNGSVVGQDWNFSDLGPDVWPDIYPDCGGYEQSPIDIPTKKTKYKSFSRFKLSNDYMKTVSFQLNRVRNGVLATLPSTTDALLTVSGGGLKGTFKFINFHFHWGQNYASGSEHRVDGKKYAAELHVYHQNVVTQKYARFAFLIESIRDDVSSDDNVNNALQSFFLAGQSAVINNTTVTLSLNLGKAIENYLETFWRYQGSFSTPPCTEGVTWTVFTRPIKIGDEFLERFRKHVLPLNFRDPQPLAGRRIYRNFEPHSSRKSYY